MIIGFNKSHFLHKRCLCFLLVLLVLQAALIMWLLPGDKPLDGHTSDDTRSVLSPRGKLNGHIPTTFWCFIDRTFTIDFLHLIFYVIFSKLSECFLNFKKCICLCAVFQYNKFITVLY